MVASKRGTAALGLVLGAALWASSCGDGGTTLPDPGPDSGLSGTAAIRTQSAADDATLCNWLAGRLGGWGRSRQCGAATVMSPANEATCVSDFQSLSSTCSLTVGDLQNCVDAAISGPCPSSAIPSQCATLI